MDDDLSELERINRVIGELNWKYRTTLVKSMRKEIKRSLEMMFEIRCQIINHLSNSRPPSIP